MKRKMLLLLITLLSASALSAAEGWCSDFARTTIEGGREIPAGWRFDAAKIGVNKSVFYLQQEKDSRDGKVLVATADVATGALMTKVEIDLKKTPIMRWRWRYKTLPVGGDGRDSKKDDQAIGIYLGVNGSFGFKESLAYRWETVTPVGASGEARYGMGIVKIYWFCVADEKSAKPGEWLTEERDVAADFEKYLGKNPKEFALSVVCNSQYTNSTAEAELDYIEFISRAEAAKAGDK